MRRTCGDHCRELDEIRRRIITRSERKKEEKEFLLVKKRFRVGGQMLINHEIHFQF